MIRILALVLLFLNGCSQLPSDIKETLYTEKGYLDSLDIHEGYVCTSAERILYFRGQKKCATITLTKPIMVAKANQEEDWGFFQFPSIGKTDEGTLVVTWQMSEDSHTAYGKPSSREVLPMMSNDNGLTWEPVDNNYFALSGSYFVHLQNGNSLQVYTPTSRDIQTYDSFPKPIAKDNVNKYYLLNRLPDNLRGIYFTLFDKEHHPQTIHSRLHDHCALRFAIEDMMPVIWWGNIKQLADKSLVAGVYPSYYLDCIDSTVHESVSFYRSENEGFDWNLVGRISYLDDGIASRMGGSGYEEPTFEILRDSSLVCVMRTGSSSPMYISKSQNMGRNWTAPKPFTPNGVMPSLLLLKNGVLALASGRPGVQIRFSFDGSGSEWSDPIEMIPYMHKDGSYTQNVSCGYASIIEADENAFYIVYSDFTTRNIIGQRRKSIWFRKVSIDID